MQDPSFNHPHYSSHSQNGSLLLLFIIVILLLILFLDCGYGREILYSFSPRDVIHPCFLGLLLFKVCYLFNLLLFILLIMIKDWDIDSGLQTWIM